MTTQQLFDMTPADTFYSDEEASRLILHNIQDAFVLVDSRLVVVYSNRAAQEGMSSFLGVDIFPGMNIMDLVRHDRKEQVALIYAEVLKGKQHVTESSFPLPGGSIIYFENTFIPARNADGQIVGVIISSKNITARKNAQQLVQESEARLQFALEATRQGAWDWNLQTNEIFYSSSYKKLYGFSEDELKNHVSEWMTRIHPDDKKKMQASVDEHLQAPDPVYDSQYRILAKDGQYRWVAAKGLLIYNEETGEPVRMIGTHTDITEKMEQEFRLKQMNERFDCMMKATDELLWEWDIANNSIFYSEDGLKKVYGVADNGSIVTIEKWLQRVHPDDQERASNLLREIMKAAHQQTFELEYRFRRDDGSYADVYNRGILLKDEKDRPVRLIGSAQDISERKRLEKELLKKELEYQRRIHQATIDSQEKERAEIGKELHDNVNQVLTTTKLYLDLAQANPELREELIAKSMKSISNVIQEIRQLSRSLMDPCIGDLGLLDSIHDLIENIHLTQKLHVELIADEAVETSLDPAQKLAVFRIIQESLNNVLRHAKATTATVTISLSDGWLQLHIVDNGTGFRLESVKKGAGLKNIHNRIYLINGTLQIETEPGKGCHLVIQFPIKNTH
jgi:PAS domain S-box-containing protein